MIKLVYIVRKRDDVSDAEFHRYWLENHGPLVRSFAKTMRARKYVQSHTIIAGANAAQMASARGMGEPYDGITEVWWESLEDMTASSPEMDKVARALLEDEAKFIDLKRSTIFVTEEHVVFDYTKESDRRRGPTKERRR